MIRASADATIQVLIVNYWHTPRWENHVNNNDATNKRVMNHISIGDGTTEGGKFNTKKSKTVQQYQDDSTDAMGPHANAATKTSQLSEMQTSAHKRGRTITMQVDANSMADGGSI